MSYCLVLLRDVSAKHPNLLKYSQLHREMTLMWRARTVGFPSAGIVFGKDILTLTPSQVHRTFAVNTLSHFHLTQAFLPAMLHRGRGVVVTMSSAMGLRGACFRGAVLAVTVAVAMAVSLHSQLLISHNLSCSHSR